MFPETLAGSRIEQQGEFWDVDAAARQGQVRSENQDALSILNFADGTQVIIVCDGAGGIGGGREASQSASGVIAASLRDIWNDQGELIAADLENAIFAARTSRNRPAQRHRAQICLADLKRAGSRRQGFLSGNIGFIAPKIPPLATCRSIDLDLVMILVMGHIYPFCATIKGGFGFAPANRINSVS